ncbi:type I 3-dehydroquinate dehydratase [Oribacterium sp. C9]|uniref:type I 3-dehydroquinate dehydratase n=1 Tax=Oribacterium sp. C9 TaxID=1943579 RepID=UPI00098FD56F|nr:type I 3-dehydroquinate dehydratase [Oribacterium sp. C9]OON84919.1 type I 3-dehydroquinate dehydratase [Oribacterium sp. C9]
MPMHKVKVIVPITGEDEETILKEAAAIEMTDADAVEWRFDLAKALYSFDADSEAGDAEVYSAAETMQGILKMLSQRLEGKELLFTIRTKCQGGVFPNLPMVYEILLCEAIKSRSLDLIDIEDTTDPDSMERIMDLAKQYDVKTIVSYHDFDQTPDFDEILDKFDSIKSTGADIIKTAYMPGSASDVARVLSATAYYKEHDGRECRLITMSMGDLGKISRVSGAIFGSEYTFAAVGDTSAPGQMPIKTARYIMDALRGSVEPNVYLVGFMASGKSTVAARLKELTGKPVFEMDQCIVDKMGMSISDIFDKFGEQRFREIETETLMGIGAENGAIVSTGGGAPMRQENRDIMARKGKVIYLSVRPETVVSRLSVNQTERPLLKGHVDIDYVRELLGKRDPVYREAADVVIETDLMSVDEISRAIIDIVK